MRQIVSHCLVRCSYFICPQTKVDVLCIFKNALAMCARKHCRLFFDVIFARNFLRKYVHFKRGLAVFMALGYVRFEDVA